MTERKPLTARQKKTLMYKGTRTAIQIMFFILAPSLFTEAFGGIKSIFQSFSAGQVLEYNSFVKTLVILCGFTILTGRFFCGYACAFGAIGDWIYALSQYIQKVIGKKKGKKVRLPDISKTLQRRLQWIKYGILAIIVILCAMGVYGSLHGWSPWDVFSMFRAWNLRLSGYAVGVILLILIVIGMAWKERFFCQFLCPMGAVFALLPVLPWTKLNRERENCLKGCSVCERNCPTAVSLEKDGFRDGECIRCNRCTENCPKRNIGTSISSWKGNEIWSLILEAVLLLGMVLLPMS